MRRLISPGLATVLLLMLIGSIAAAPSTIVLHVDGMT